MKTYRAECKYRHVITEHEIIKESDKFVTCVHKGFSEEREIRESKESSDYKHFRNFNDAKQWLMDMIDIKIKNTQAQTDKLKSEIQKVNNL